jgi:hypothetical protein
LEEYVGVRMGAGSDRGSNCVVEFSVDDVFVARLNTFMDDHIIYRKR